MLPDLPGPILKELFDIPLTVEEERGEFAFHLLDEEYLRRTWSEHRAALLASWVEKHPGTRPQAWWRYDAPREPQGRGQAGPTTALDLPRRAWAASARPSTRCLTSRRATGSASRARGSRPGRRVLQRHGQGRPRRGDQSQGRRRSRTLSWRRDRSG